MTNAETTVAPAFWPFLNTATAALGSEGFYRALGAAFAATVGVKRWLVMRFGLRDVPEILHNGGGMSEEAIAFYVKGLYRLDPLTRLARRGSAPLVVSFSRLRESDADNRYYDEIYRTALIRDEIAAMLPLPGGAYVTLNLDSAESDFPDPVMARAEEVAGTFLGLHQAHLRLAAPTSTSALPDQPSPAPEALPAYDALIDRMAERHAMTAREREIAHRALRGYPNALIARDLGITAGTVRNHRARLYAKLDITSERELFALCLETLLDSPVSAPV